MQVTISPDIKQDNDLFLLVNSQTGILENEIGERDTTAEARWELKTDEKNRKILVLKIKDLWGESQGDFAPAELNSERQLRKRFYDLLGDLLTNNANKKIEQWKNELENLYENIQEWLRDSRYENAKINRFPIELNERLSGKYQVNLLRIGFLKNQLDIKPIAKWVVGADGRADIMGGGGSFVLILMESQWYWVENRPGKVRKLDKDLFLSLADEFLK